MVRRGLKSTAAAESVVASNIIAGPSEGVLTRLKAGKELTAASEEGDKASFAWASDSMATQYGYHLSNVNAGRDSAFQPSLKDLGRDSPEEASDAEAAPASAGAPYVRSSSLRSKILGEGNDESGLTVPKSRGRPKKSNPSTGQSALDAALSVGPDGSSAAGVLEPVTPTRKPRRRAPRAAPPSVQVPGRGRGRPRKQPEPEEAVADEADAVGNDVVESEASAVAAPVATSTGTAEPVSPSTPANPATPGSAGSSVRRWFSGLFSL